MNIIACTPFAPWTGAAPLSVARESGPAWVPSFDIEETDAAYLLRGDIPGSAKDSIEVRVQDGVLSVLGERKAPETEARFRRFERPSGKFLRRFRLPEAADADGVAAAYEAGVLEITVPKRPPEDLYRRIAVN